MEYFFQAQSKLLPDNPAQQQKALQKGMATTIVVFSLLWVGSRATIKASPMSCDSANVYRCLLENTCIPLSKKCDGVWDCQHGADELFCSSGKACDQFLCKNGRCISTHWRCDGENDCLDFSDEENCKAAALPPPDSRNCSEAQFRCSDGLCIPTDWVCDGAEDCLKGEDEKEGTCEGKKPVTCLENQFRCLDKLRCIPHSGICDESADCADQSDEGEHCGRNKTQEHGQMNSEDTKPYMSAFL
jgi:hypothetical protein